MMTEFICEECGATFRRQPTRRCPKPRYCGQLCAGRAIGKAGKGDKNPNARPLAERFWEKVDKSGECWLWMGRTDRRGYGYTSVNRRSVGAHRIAYELTYGKTLDGLYACHSCDNPRCVRPDHIFPGTPTDNVQDCLSKGRFKVARHDGVYNPNAKLNWTKAAEIRADHAAGLSVRELMQKYAVGETAIRDVVAGKKWAESREAARRAREE